MVGVRRRGSWWGLHHFIGGKEGKFFSLFHHLFFLFNLVAAWLPVWTISPPIKVVTSEETNMITTAIQTVIILDTSRWVSLWMNKRMWTSDISTRCTYISEIYYSTYVADCPTACSWGKLIVKTCGWFTTGGGFNYICCIVPSIDFTQCNSEKTITALSNCPLRHPIN